MTWRITRYTPEQKELWDSMAARSRNATFLLSRDYMDYHSDRFADCSLIALANGRPMALLPANRRGEELFSHQGLTYGGWMLPHHKVDGAGMMSLFGTWLDWCRNERIEKIHYKPLPYIYALQPSQEELYALWRYGATQESVLLSSAIDKETNPGFDYLRRRYLKKVSDAGVTVTENSCFSSFWRVLEQCLSERHEASPVHTLEEIQRLHDLFPENIRLYEVRDQDGVQGGTVIYRCGTTDHCQYIASTAAGRAGRYLPFLFRHVIDASTARYFDFGTSNGQGGRWLNASLLANKFGYGATGVVYTQYLITP